MDIHLYLRVTYHKLKYPKVSVFPRYQRDYEAIQGDLSKQGDYLKGIKNRLRQSHCLVLS